MARGDFYASPFGVAYSTYMERPAISRLVGKLIWGGDMRPYYESMEAVRRVAAGGTVVDCPCGAGPALRGLAPQQQIRYIAVDLSPSMLRRLRRQAQRRDLSQVEPIQASATELPLEEASADLFLSYWGLHCFSDPKAALVEAARVLRSEGRLVGSTFVRGDGSLRQRWLVRSGRGDFGNVGSADQMANWLEEAGFVEPAIRRSGPMMFFNAQRT